MSYETSLEEFDLSISTLHRLRKMEINTLRDLQDLFDEGLEEFLEKRSLTKADFLLTKRHLQEIKRIIDAIDSSGLSNSSHLSLGIRRFVRALPLSFLEVPDDVLKRFTLFMGSEPNIGQLRRLPSRIWFRILQDYSTCRIILTQLNAFGLFIRNQDDFDLDKETFLRTKTKYYMALEELEISKKLYTTLISNNISSIAQLLSFSAAELKEKKIAADAAIATIRNALRDVHLLLKDDYFIFCRDCEQRFVSDETDGHTCENCKAKKKRISKISKLDINISGPEYGSFTDLLHGFVLYANIKNTTSDLLNVKLLSTYVVEDDKQISPVNFLKGYYFENEVIMPDTVRSAGQIWSTERFILKSSLSNGTYLILSVKLSSEPISRMYKFVYKDNSWEIDDYFHT